MKNSIYLFLLALLPVMACHKDNNANTAPPVGRWKFNPTLIQSYANGTLQSTSRQTFQETDYFEFKANGTAEAYALGRLETFPYAINRDSVTINQKKGKINTLTANSFNYTMIDTASTNSYTKVTWDLYK